MDSLIRLAGISWCVLLASQVFAESTVYEICNGKNKIYLAGTIHILRDQDFPLPAEFDAAYKQSQKIYFETDLQKSKSPDFGKRFAQAMLLPNNKTLKDELNPDAWSALQLYSDKNQYPLAQTMMFNAVMASILITLHETKRIGAGDGVDAYYDKMARADNKAIGELETSDDVIDYMRRFGQEDPNKIILSTLDDIKDINKNLKKMTTAWRQGDLDTLDKELAEKMRQEIHNTYQILVVERNKKWLPQIEKMLTTPEVDMVLVGSLHLSGKDGLLSELKKSGYTVKRYHLKK